MEFFWVYRVRMNPNGGSKGIILSREAIENMSNEIYRVKRSTSNSKRLSNVFDKLKIVQHG